MNETSEQLFVKSSLPSEPVGADGVTAGDLLRQAREAQNIELASLAAVLKISESKLRALEDNDYSRLPEMAFVRGLAKSVCKRLDIDEKPVLDLLPALHGSPTLRFSMDLSGRSSTALKGERYRGSKRSKLWIVLAILIIVLLALLFVFTDSSSWKKALSSNDEPSQGNTEQVLTDDQGSGAVTRTLQLPGLGVNEGSSSSSSYELPSLSLEGASENDLSADVNNNVPSSDLAAQPLGEMSTSGSTPVAAQDLRFTATGATSITVKNRDDKVVLTRTLKKDETVDIPLENLPLKVNVGNVKATTVELRGETFDLKPYTKRNTANFEVK